MLESVQSQQLGDYWRSCGEYKQMHGEYIYAVHAPITVSVSSFFREYEVYLSDHTFLIYPQSS